MRYLHPPLRLSVVGEFFAKSRSSVMVCWVLAGLFCVFSFPTSSHGKTSEYLDFARESLYHDEEALAYELDALVAELTEYGWDFEGEAELESFSLEEKVVVLNHVLALIKEGEANKGLVFAFQDEYLVACDHIKSGIVMRNFVEPQFVTTDGSFVYDSADKGYEVALNASGFEIVCGGGPMPEETHKTGFPAAAVGAAVGVGLTEIGKDVLKEVANDVSDTYRRAQVRKRIREAIKIKNDSSLSDAKKARLIEKKKAKARKHNESITSESSKYTDESIDDLDLESMKEE